LWRARSRASLVALGVGEATVRFGHLGPPLPSAAPPGAAPVRPPPQPSALRQSRAVGCRAGAVTSSPIWRGPARQKVAVDAGVALQLS
jgi:hypothetical protein